MQLWQQCEEKERTNHNQTSSCFTVSIQENSEENHKRAPTQIKAKCAEGGFGEVMSHTHPLLTETVVSVRQDRAAPGHPCIRCCLWLLPLSSQLCCWQWKIICVLLRLNVLHTVSAQKTHGWHFALCISNIQSDRAGKHLVLKTSCDTDRETLDTRERESIFPSGLF